MGEELQELDLTDKFIEEIIMRMRRLAGDLARADYADDDKRLKQLTKKHLVSRKELIRYFNEDITDDELAEKMGELQEEEQPQQIAALVTSIIDQAGR